MTRCASVITYLQVPLCVFTLHCNKMSDDEDGVVCDDVPTVMAEKNVIATWWQSRC